MYYASDYTRFYFLKENDLFVIVGIADSYFRKISEECFVGAGGKVYFVDDEDMIVRVINL